MALRTEFLCGFRQETMIPDTAEECVLMDLDPDSGRRHGGGSQGNVYDEDESGPGSSRVQCATH